MPQLRAIQTRQRTIIAVAMAINRRTYDRASITDIVKLGGITQGSFYFHFSSKEAAAHAVMETQNNYSQRKAQDVVELNLPGAETLLRVSAGLVYDIAEDPIIRAGVRLTTEIQILESPPLLPWDQWTAFNAHILEQLKNDNVLKSEVIVSDVAELITSGIAGIHNLSNLYGDLPSLPRRAHAMWQQFIRANINADNAEPYKALATDLFLGRTPRAPLTYQETFDRHISSMQENGTEELLKAD